jgi:hypothetical protein
MAEGNDHIPNYSCGAFPNVGTWISLFKAVYGNQNANSQRRYFLTSLEPDVLAHYMSLNPSAYTMTMANNLSWLRSYSWERVSVDQLEALWETIRQGATVLIDYVSYIFDLFKRINSAQPGSLPEEKLFEKIKKTVWKEFRKVIEKIPQDELTIDSVIQACRYKMDTIARDQQNRGGSSTQPQLTYVARKVLSKSGDSTMMDDAASLLLSSVFSKLSRNTP